MTPLAITAIGMTSSLGQGSEDCCAAARAGLVRLSEINTLNTTIDPLFAKEGLDGVPLFVGHLAAAVSAGYTGLAKLLALSRPALAEILTKTALTPQQLARTGFCMSITDAFFQTMRGAPTEGVGDYLPEPDDAWRRVASEILPRLCATFNLPIRREAQFASRRGRLGLLEALEQASRWIAAGLVDRCFIGATESCVEPAVLQAYGLAGAVKSAANPVGFLPGEAAVFLLVEPVTTAGYAAAPVKVTAMAVNEDAAYFDDKAVPHGRGIFDAIMEAQSARTHSPATLPALVIADLNGTEQRAMDWGHAQVKLRGQFGDYRFDLWLPAQSFGETGAVAGLIAICMTFEAARRGYMPGATALVVLCAENGGRGTLLLETQRPSVAKG